MVHFVPEFCRERTLGTLVLLLLCILFTLSKQRELAERPTLLSALRPHGKSHLTLTRLAVWPQSASLGTLAVKAAYGVAAVALTAAVIPLTFIHVWEEKEGKISEWSHSKTL